MKNQQGYYWHDGMVPIQYPITEDEALYAYHLC